MPPSSTILRTYGRKGHAKRKRLAEQTTADAAQDANSLPTKRPKLSVLIQDDKHVPPDRVETTGKKSEKAPMSLKPTSRKETKALGAKAGLTSPPALAARPATSSGMGFEEILNDALSPSVSSQSSPKKIAKRMLARSKTEPAVKVIYSRVDRTPSLPSLPTTSLPQDPPVAAPTPTTAEAFDPSTLDPPEPPPLPIRPQTNARTYAGKSRSFLISLPASSMASRALMAGTQSTSGTPDWQEEDEEELQRESYADLRTRWGIDNSEDDPYPASDSPSDSPPHYSQSKPNSPGRAGKASKGKHAKASIPAPTIFLPNGMMNPLKSITELRSHGESRRFMDEVGYLIEGIGPDSGLSLRRASALEITTKLCDLDFARRAKAADFLSRTWDTFREAGAGRGEDVLFDCLLLFFIALVARDPSSLLDLAQRPPIAPQPASNIVSIGKGGRLPSSTPSPHANSKPLVELLLSLLDLDDDPLRLISSSQASKGHEGTVDDVDVVLRGIGVEKKDKATISTSLLVIYALNALPPTIIPTSQLSTLLNSLKKEAERMGIPTSGSNLGVIWLGDVHKELPYMESLLLHLRALDSYLLDQWADKHINTAESSQATELISLSEDNDDAHESAKQPSTNNNLEAAQLNWLLQALIGLGVQNEICLRNCAKGLVQCKGADKVARRSLEMVFRVLVSLTHKNLEWCRAFIDLDGALLWIVRVIAGVLNDSDIREQDRDSDVSIDDEVPEVDEEESALRDEKMYKRDSPHTLDRLCLALGLLANLVQMMDETKSLFRTTRLSPSCELKRKNCLRTCACHQSQSILEILVRVYTHYSPKSRPTTSIVTESAPHHIGSDDGDGAEASFLRGHLAVLFGLLMMGSLENQEIILSTLPGIGDSNSNRECTRNGDESSIPSRRYDTKMSRRRSAEEKLKLTELADQAQELVAWYDRVLRSDGDGGDSDDEDHGAGARIARDDDHSEGKVARDVVKFLERLRDDGR
ncbi:hypothetical protein AX16_001470 [Volvariella volvacea WC 439]|nr:hypothetical protein AX16_001470 [Volvariella volvacea WC 439]